MDQVERLAAAGKPRDGVILIEREAEGGHAEALFILANWRLWGVYGPRDLPAVHGLLAKAAAAGWAEAAPLLANLIGNGTGCRSDPERARQVLEQLAGTDPRAAEQLALLSAMPTVTPPVEQALSTDPDVRMIRDFLTAKECDYLVRNAGPKLQPSMIVDPHSGRPRPHPVRTSSSMNFDPSSEDLVVHAINRRIATMTATDVEAGEPLHILRYAPGQEYRLHFDALPNVSNQRQWTALIYLNQGFGGGETAFPDIAIKTRGRTGDCLIFRVTSDDGLADRRLRHAGLPVTEGVKWLASRWIRQRPYEAEIQPVSRA